MLACLGIGLLIVGQIVTRRDRDPVAKRLAQMKPEVRALEELEMQQPFSERVLRPVIRWLASALGRVQQGRSNEPASAREQGIENIRQKLAIAGNPYRWTPADYLGTKIFAAAALGGVLFFLLSISGHTG